MSLFFPKSASFITQPIGEQIEVDVYGRCNLRKSSSIILALNRTALYQSLLDPERYALCPSPNSLDARHRAFLEVMNIFGNNSRVNIVGELESTKSIVGCIAGFINPFPRSALAFTLVQQTEEHD